MLVSTLLSQKRNPKKAKSEQSKAQEYLNSDEPTVLTRLMPDSSKYVPGKHARAYRHRWGEKTFPKFEAVSRMLECRKLNRAAEHVLDSP